MMELNARYDWARGKVDRMREDLLNQRWELSQILADPDGQMDVVEMAKDLKEAHEIFAETMEALDLYRAGADLDRLIEGKIADLATFDPFHSGRCLKAIQHSLKTLKTLKKIAP